MKLEDKIFEKHYRYYMDVGIETIKQQSGQVEQVSTDYQGRVIFELLQNAFDKAEKNILVEVKGNSLFIANDGTKFTYNVNHDYRNGSSDSDKFTRYDFQSLCSISTSSKITSDNIGNKGVGFKSVFSVAKESFANVFTEGIMVDNGQRITERISFGIYDSYKDINSIPNKFEEDIKRSIEKQIKQIQQERKERGVPGYYYPLHITEEPREIIDYFNKGYVTVIEIPFQSIELIKPLFEEIKNIHFNFVALKYHNAFNINFNLNGESFRKQINTESGLFFSTTIKNEAIEQAAINAGVQIGLNNSVAICFKSINEIESGEEGLIYNYLPTKQKSPFKFVDFHADFHTSVDRKTIEFDTKSKIGRYNAALLKSCIELLFNVINNSLSEAERTNLNIENINQQQASLKSFNWKYFAINNSGESYRIVRNILKFDDENVNQWNHDDNCRYVNAVHFICGLARQFFNVQNISEDERNDFFDNVANFIHNFTNDYKMQYSRSQIFKKELALGLLNKKLQLLPNIYLDDEIEVLYKEKDNEVTTLPDFMGVNITNYKIPDEYLSGCLGIKKYSDINVLFKYFRQTSIKGELSDKKLNESEQIKLLKSLFQLFKTKKEKIVSIAHRYESFFSESDRRYYSAQNITAFSVSTVFLKTKDGKYKPAQLCNINELEETFIDKVIDEEAYKESFLYFIGVSPETNYLVADKKLYDHFIDGIDFIPTPYSRDETENLTGRAIIPNIIVVTSKKQIHPALINYNRYPFLEDISNKKIQKHLTPLNIGDYSSFPPEYAEILLSTIKENTMKYPQDVFRLYSANTFHLFHKQSEYLIVNKGKYSWTNDTNFKIAQNRNDFELLKNQDIDLLCFFNGKEVPDNLQQNFIELKTIAVEINNQVDITQDFRQRYEALIPYILAEISYLNTSISEKDYIKNLDEIKAFQLKWNSISVVTGDKLAILLEYQKDAEPLMLPQISSLHQNTLYFDNAISNNKKAEAIAKNIFNIGSLSAKIELIFFHKKPEDIKAEYNQDDINEIIKMWLPDYYKTFEAFQKEILDYFELTYVENDLWYIYNDSHKSEILIKLNNENRLNELIQLVNNCKEKEEYSQYFEGFHIEIDRSHISSKVSELLVLLNEIGGDPVMEKELNALSRRLGCESRLVQIYNDINSKHPDFAEKNLSTQKSAKKKEVEIKNRIEEILNKVPGQKNKTVKDIDLIGTHNIKQIPIKRKQIVYKGEKLPDLKTLETIGASGEEEVLLYFINEFISIGDIKKRKDAINKVYALLKKKIGDDSLLKYRNDCLYAIDNDEKLKRTLIPLFYVTMHHKFSFFDLIVFHENEPTLVEVKTTTNNKTFYLSIAEVDAARSEDNYIIVRNTSDCIYLLGNPIKNIEKGITFIEGEKFTLKARNYELKLLGDSK